MSQFHSPAQDKAFGTPGAISAEFARRTQFPQHAGDGGAGCANGSG